MSLLPPRMLQAALLAGLIGAPLGAQAQVAQVKVWAAACANCHGTNGQAQPGMASLAGRSASELSQRLLDYKNDRLPATVMHQIAKGYSDEQIHALAGYFAALPRAN